jgi:hypothetical protein
MTTNEITASKTEFALDLASAGLSVEVSTYIPDRITPPVVIMKSGSPYLIPASVGNEYLMQFDLVCVVGTATNNQATEKLEALIEATLKALPGYAQMVSVGQPYALATNSAEYLAADINTNIQITI